MKEDLSGRSQFFRNVVVSWLAHGFVLAAGFIVPRQISDNLGANALGIWDLGWGSVQYLSLTNLGLSMALTRHTALYRAQNKPEDLNRVATVMVVLQTLVSALVMLGALIFAKIVETTIEFENQIELEEAKTVVIYLGATLAIRMLVSPAGGLITGCHRQDIQSTINAAQDVIISILLILVLIYGGSLSDLALAVLCVGCAIAFLRVAAAKKLVPDVKISRDYWRNKVALKMLRFGSKSIVDSTQKVMIFQTVSFFLAAHAGPAAVAIFNRSLALVKHMEVLTRKFSILFTTVASGLIGLDKKEEANELLVRSVRYAMAVVLPIALGLIFYGDLVLKIWMGEGYDDWPMLVILVCGAILPIAQSGAQSVLTGFNAHGKLAIASLICITLVLGISLTIVTLKNIWSPVLAAVVVCASWSVGQGLVIPIFLKLKFSISLSNYFISLLLLPGLCNLPFAFCLHIGRQQLQSENPYFLLTWLIGLLSLLLMYWFFLLDGQSRQSIKRKWV